MEDNFSNRLRIYLLWEAINRNYRWTVISAIFGVINMILSIAIFIKLAIAH